MNHEKDFPIQIDPADGGFIGFGDFGKDAGTYEEQLDQMEVNLLREAMLSRTDSQEFSDPRIEFRQGFYNTQREYSGNSIYNDPDADIFVNEF